MDAKEDQVSRDYTPRSGETKGKDIDKSRLIPIPSTGMLISSKAESYLLRSRCPA